MPITFQAPEPVAPAASYGYGAAEIGSRNNSVLAGLYSDAARLTSQANLEGARLQQEGAIARSQQETARGNEQARLAEEGRQFDRARLDRQGAQEFDARADFAKQQQRTELAAWLNEQELSQKDELRLRTMRNSVAEIGNDPNLSPDERAAAVAKLKTGIDVYQMRQQKALAKQEEAHAQQYEAQAKRQTEVALKNADLNAKTLEDRTVTIPTPEGQAEARRRLGAGASPADVRQWAIDNGYYTQQVQVGFDQYGHPTWKAAENPHGAARQKAAEDLDAIRLKDYANAVAKAERDNDAWSKQRDAKQAALAEKAGTVPEPLTPDQIHQNFLDTLKARGLAQTWEEQRARKYGGSARDDVGGGDVPGPGSGQIPPAPEKPFDEDKDASPRQRQQLDSFRSSVAAVKALPIPERAKDDYARATRTVEGMLREYGSVSQDAMAGMSAKDAKELTDARLTIERVEALTFRGGRRVSPARQAVERVPGLAGPAREPGAHQRQAMDVRPWLREHLTTPVAEGVGGFFTPRDVPGGQ